MSFLLAALSANIKHSLIYHVLLLFFVTFKISETTRRGLWLRGWVWVGYPRPPLGAHFNPDPTHSPVIGVHLTNWHRLVDDNSTAMPIPIFRPAFDRACSTN